jgi:hypothetical protein
LELSHNAVGLCRKGIASKSYCSRQIEAVIAAYNYRSGNILTVIAFKSYFSTSKPKVIMCNAVTFCNTLPTYEGNKQYEKGLVQLVGQSRTTQILTGEKAREINMRLERGRREAASLNTSRHPVKKKNWKAIRADCLRTYKAHHKFKDNLEII